MSGKNHAILIGINDYHTNPLRFCVNDVLLIRSKLISNCNFLSDYIFSVISSNDEPVSDIAGKLNEIIDTLNKIIQPEDTILFYYSGHGKVKDEFLLELHDAEISLYSIYRRLNAMNAKHQLYIIDACFSGAATEIKGNELEAINQYYREKIAHKSESLQILCSCRDTQTSIARPELQNSVYTYYLIKAIDNSNLYDIEFRSLSLTQIHEYAVKQLEINREVQIPLLATQLSGYHPFAYNRVPGSFSESSELIEIYTEQDIYSFLGNQAIRLPETFRRDFAQFFSELSMNLFTHNNAQKITVAFYDTTIEIHDFSSGSFDPFEASPSATGMGVRVYKIFLEKYKGKVQATYQAGSPNIIRLIFDAIIFDHTAINPCHIYVSEMFLGSPTPLNNYSLPPTCGELVIDVSKSDMPLSVYPKLIRSLLARTSQNAPLIIIKMHQDDMLRRTVHRLISSEGSTRILLL